MLRHSPNKRIRTLSLSLSVCERNILDGREGGRGKEGGREREMERGEGREGGG